MEEEVEELISQLIISHKRLLELGVLRSALSLGDYFEWFCVQHFNLNLNESQVSKGYDAIDSEGNRIQIKSRYWREYGNSFDNLNLDEFDFLMAVIYGKDTFLVETVHKIPVDVIKNIGLGANNRFRWTRQTQLKCEEFKIYQRGPIKLELYCPYCDKSFMSEIEYIFLDRNSTYEINCQYCNSVVQFNIDASAYHLTRLLHK